MRHSRFRSLNLMNLIKSYQYIVCDWMGAEYHYLSFSETNSVESTKSIEFVEGYF